MSVPFPPQRIAKREFYSRLFAPTDRDTSRHRFISTNTGFLFSEFYVSLHE